jgi:hypothetical protein
MQELVHSSLMRYHGVGLGNVGGWLVYLDANTRDDHLLTVLSWIVSVFIQYMDRAEEKKRKN